MQDSILDCHDARSRIEGYLNGVDTSSALAAHLARCESCLEVCLELALRQPAEYAIPADFTASLLARIPQVGNPRSVLPYALVAACALFTLTGWMVISSGLLLSLIHSMAQMRWQVALALLGSEAALTLLWCWRVARAG